MPDEYTVSVIEEEEALQFRLRGHLAKPAEPGHLLVGQELHRHDWHSTPSAITKRFRATLYRRILFGCYSHPGSVLYVVWDRADAAVLTYARPELEVHVAAGIVAWARRHRERPCGRHWSSTSAFLADGGD